MSGSIKQLKISYEKTDIKNPIKGTIKESKNIYRMFKYLESETKEKVIGIYLNKDRKVNSFEVLSIGGADMGFIVPEEIYKGAIVTNSPYFIIVHNHTSGDSSPTKSDKDVIEVIKEGAKWVRKYFLDFVIIGDDNYWSYYDTYEDAEPLNKIAKIESSDK